MKIALAQINTTVGDFAGNGEKISAAYRRGIDAGAELVIFPELATCGYPPRDLLTKPHFVQANLDLVQQLAEQTGECGMLLGFVERNERRPGRGLSNSVALLHRGKIEAVRAKTLLPTYDVFDEDRYFDAAAGNRPVEFKTSSLGLTVCEDLWNDEDFWQDGRRYADNPGLELARGGADLIINCSASPWHLGKNRLRRDMLASFTRKAGRPLVYCNLVGGNDELVFDGGSLVFNSAGELIAAGKVFEEDFLLVDTDGATVETTEESSDEEKIYSALVLGVRDYLNKCDFRSALLGLSGGIDSALTAVISVDALGRENVRGVAMPSEYSSAGSRADARALAKNLGIQFDEIPIQPSFNTIRQQLESIFAGRPDDTTEENMQARLRGVTLMAMSNKLGSLLLTTGNKSELAVGYCTLYGDMCGGLAVLSDVPKTMVYRIARWLNRNGELIPVDSITKPPSAELRPDQKDQDSLPPYDILDAILEEYVVNCRSVDEIVAQGFAAEVVQRIVRLIDINEYKRRQAAPGLKITTKAFGVGRRMPIAQRFRNSSKS